MATASWLGNDGSGNNNYWAVSNVSLSSGSTYDPMVDVPGIAAVSSQTDVGGVQRGNYCTWNPVSPTGNVTFSNANLTATSTVNSIKTVIGTISADTSNKWYFEITISAQSDAYRCWLGFIAPGMKTDETGGFYLCDAPGFSATWNSGNTTVTYGTSAKFTSSPTGGFDITTATVSDTKAVNDIYMFAYDGTTGKIWFGKNGSWFGSGSPTAGGNPAGVLSNMYNYTPAASMNVTGSGNAVTLNCGQRPFTYTPPTGFKSICTTNLPTPVIKRPEQHFDVKTYTGNATGLTVGNVQRESSGTVVPKSLRFSGARRTFLERTFGTPTNANIWTLSTWFKPPGQGGTVGSLRFLAPRWTTGTEASTGHPYVGFAGGGIIYGGIWDNVTSYWNCFAENIKYFDTSRWYHLTYVYDSTHSVATERVRMYVDGLRINPSTYTAPTQNTGVGMNNSGLRHSIGTRYYTSDKPDSDGYMAEWRFIDGQALDPSNFGQFNADNQWVPKTYTGTYGNNGAYLNFSDDRNATTIGYDTSGNGNHWTDYHHSIVSPTVVSYNNPRTYSWTAPAGVTSVNYLVVAGGGGGGQGVPTRTTGGGGGAGGFLTGTLSVTPGTSYTVTVGAGGQGGTSPASGGNSVFASITAIGGGYGAYGGNDGAVGGNGGSGGGSSGPFAGGTYAGGSGTAGQGNPGGSASQYSGSGGGGAGGTGGAGNAGAAGGIGAVSGITGVNTYYAGGGAGGSAAGWTSTNFTMTAGGLGGGGGTMTGPAVGQGGSNGTNGLGGGGGGGSNPGITAGSGGHGCVILSYTGMTTGYSTSSWQDNTKDSPWEGGGADTIDHGGEISGNYAVLVPNASNSTSIVDAGLTHKTTGTTNSQIVRGSIGVSRGKWYYECFISNRMVPAQKVGIAKETATGELGDTADAWAMILQNNASNGQSINGGSISSVWTSFATGDILQVAVDMDKGMLWFGKNGTWLQGDPSAGTSPMYANISGTIYPALTNYRKTADNEGILNFNFGSKPFEITPPTGFKSWNTRNVGNNGNFVNGPDLVWIKVRSTTGNHSLFDTVRGVRNHLSPSLTTAAEQPTAGSGLQSFNPNGFSLGTDIAGVSGGETNGDGFNLVSWMWNRGKVPGFDIVSYSGNGTAGNRIAHNLGVAPAMVIIKNLTTGTTNWPVYHKAITSLSNTSVLYLNDTTYPGVITANLWNSTAPGNAYFTVGDTSAVNASGSSYIAYLWAEVPGFSKFGSYVGNGSADGPFIYTGFKPKWIMIKAISTTGGWNTADSVRSTINPVDKVVYPHLNNAEETYTWLDFTSNGFKLRSTLAGSNTNGTTYAYAVFAENPLKYANAR